MISKQIIGKPFQVTVVTLLLLSVIVMSFLMFGYSAQKRDNRDMYNADGKLVYLTYGLPPTEVHQNATKVVAARWGFTFRGVAGCMVTKKLADSVAAHNYIVNQIMVGKYGNDWYKKYDKEVTREQKKVQEMTNLVDKERYIINTRALLEKGGNGLHYLFKPTADTNRYTVIAEGWNLDTAKEAWITYYKLRVDYQLKTIDRLSEEPKK